VRDPGGLSLAPSKNFDILKLKVGGSGVGLGPHPTRIWLLSILPVELEKKKKGNKIGERFGWGIGTLGLVLSSLPQPRGMVKHPRPSPNPDGQNASVMACA
jgi:hypothetical protein